MLEALSCFEEERVGTPKTVNLARVRLPSGEAVSAFELNIHLMGEKLQPFMDFALGADANVTDMFHFQDTGLQVAGSQRDVSPTNCCVAGCREMTRLILLANLKSLQLLEGEGVILPCVPGAGDCAAPTPLSVAPESVAPLAEGGGALLRNLVSSSTEWAPTSPAGYRAGEIAHEGPREVAIEPQSGAGPGWGQPERKRSRVDTIDHQAGDFRELLDGNSINVDQSPLLCEVSKRLCLSGYY